MSAGGLTLAFLAGCGGGGGAASPLANGDAGGIGALTLGSAHVEVDTDSGKVKITNLTEDPNARARNALYTGGAVSIETADLVVDNSTIGRRVVSVRLRNHTNEVIGATNGFRLVLQNLATGNQPGQDIRPGLTAGTLAGNGSSGATDGIALNANVQPTAVAAYGPNAILFGEATRVRLLRNGTVSTLRNGIGNVGGIVYLVDPTGRNEFAVYTERTNHRVQVINLSSGSVSTFAGTGVAGDVVGAPNVTQFNTPIGLALEPPTATGGALLVVDSVNNKVKRLPYIWTGGAPVAQTTSTRYSSVPGHSVAVSSTGSVAVSDPAGHRVRIFAGGGSNPTTIGTGSPGATVGLGNAAQFGTPTALAYIGETVYVHNQTSNYVQYITPVSGGATIQPSNWIVGYALGDSFGGFADGVGSSARLSSTTSGMASFGGNLVVADTGNFRIRDISSPGGRVDFGLPATFSATERVLLMNASGEMPSTAVFGGATPFVTVSNPVAARGTLDVPPLEFQVPSDVTRFSFTLQVEADTTNYTSADGVINASGPGNGSPNNFVRRILASSPMVLDGIRGSATAGLVTSLSYDNAGNLFWSEFNTVRRLDAKSGRVTTIAGLRDLNGNTDGSGETARFTDIRDIAVSGDGLRIFVVQNNHVIRQIFRAGQNPERRDNYFVSTAGGLAGSSGFVYGEGGTARLTSPLRVATNADGSIVFVAEDSSTIRTITRTGQGYAANEFSHSAVVTTISGLPPSDLDWSGGDTMVYNVLESGQPRIVAVTFGSWAYTFVTSPGTQDQDQSATSYQPTHVAVDTKGQITFVSNGSASNSRRVIRRVISPLSQTAYTLAGGGFSPSDATGDRISISADRIAVAPNGDVAYASPNGIHVVTRIIRR